MDIQVNDVSKIYGTGENKVVALCHANMTIHSYEYYMSEPVVEDDAKGVGPFLLAYTEIRRLGE